MGSISAEAAANTNGGWTISVADTLDFVFLGGRQLARNTNASPTATATAAAMMMETDWELADRCEQSANVTDYLDCIKSQIIETEKEIKNLVPGNNLSAGYPEDIPELTSADQHDHDCDEGGRDGREICDKALLHMYLLGYCYPALLTLCLFGNILNLVVYTVKYLRKSLTVKLLTIKSIMNSLFMLGLSPQVIILLFSQSGDLSSSHPSDSLNAIWGLWPYSLFLSNVAGTCATWLTVLMTFERFLYITFPLQSRKWCTNSKFLKACGVLFVLAVAIHMAIPLNRVAEPRYCPSEQRFVYKLYSRSGSGYEILEPIYYWVNLFCVMTVPSVLLMLLTVAITHKMLYCSLPNYSERKRCVTRITLATTACHLTLATPAVGVYAVAVVYGPTFMNQNWMMCVCHVLMNLANQLNASICFLIYISCSDKYRKLLVCRLRGLAPAEVSAGSVERTKQQRRGGGSGSGEQNGRGGTGGCPETQRLTVPGGGGIGGRRRSSVCSDFEHSSTYLSDSQMLARL